MTMKIKDVMMVDRNNRVSLNRINNSWKLYPNVNYLIFIDGVDIRDKIFSKSKSIAVCGSYFDGKNVGIFVRIADRLGEVIMLDDFDKFFGVVKYDKFESDVNRNSGRTSRSKKSDGSKRKSE